VTKKKVRKSAALPKKTIGPIKKKRPHKEKKRNHKRGQGRTAKQLRLGKKEKIKP